MARRITEKRLVDVLVCHFRAMYPVGREVRHYEKYIDLSVAPTDSDELWAIEAKVDAWGRAISQAIVNLAAAQRSYIAIYSKNVHRVDSAELEKYGIGLISVGLSWGDVVILKEAPLSCYTNRIAARQLRNSIVGN